MFNPDTDFSSFTGEQCQVAYNQIFGAQMALNGNNAIKADRAARTFYPKLFQRLKELTAQKIGAQTAEAALANAAELSSVVLATPTPANCAALCIAGADMGAYQVALKANRGSLSPLDSRAVYAALARFLAKQRGIDLPAAQAVVNTNFPLLKAKADAATASDSLGQMAVPAGAGYQPQPVTKAPNADAMAKDGPRPTNPFLPK